ncbi:GHKL domain-containing protein [Romboutsia ilealis]|jgi:two-component system sensor histidine kinase AgrC|uniref:GHKL domain-containing protein n=1 Tax=Romboutsia ilealis TaxID=1115758 RepID=UPI0027154701|nr:GHKL domain-containing protein [Romboutsia ilealis]
MAITIIVLLQVLFSYLSTKILTRNLKFSVKELLYIVIFGSINGAMYQYLNIFTNISTFFIIITLWSKKLNIYEAILFSSFSMTISILSDHISSFLRYELFRNDILSTKEMLLLHMPLCYLIGLFLSFIGSILLKRSLHNLYTQNIAPVFLSVLSCFIWLTCLFSITFVRFIENQTRLIFFNLVFFIIYVLLFLSILYIYITTTQKNYEIEKKETVYANMERYTQDIENHYFELRKLRHDYQNILTSLENYIIQEDIHGLKSYFYSNIKQHSSEILNKEYRLKDLSKVKISPVKSIIASKLIYAQDQGLNASFESLDTITDIPMDAVLLVRILGIFLDNAIEELLSLGQGELLIGMIKNADHVLIIVQNTCREDMPAIQTLQKPHISTKHSGRGLGLGNALEIMRQCPNVFSETVVENCTFLQKIMIYDKGGE